MTDDIIVPSTRESNRVKALVLAVTSAGTTPPPAVSNRGDGEGRVEIPFSESNAGWTSEMIAGRAARFLEFLLANSDVEGADEKQDGEHGNDDQHDHCDVAEAAVAPAAGETGSGHVVHVPLDLLERTRRCLGYRSASPEANYLFAELSKLPTFLADEPFLGCATTRELLTEVASRLRGNHLGQRCTEALMAFNRSVLDYRTIDS